MKINLIYKLIMMKKILVYYKKMIINCNKWVILMKIKITLLRMESTI